MINLSRVDLNLLVVLQTILTEGGVGQAAQKLNLTQPTISHALARLRMLFDDPLFVRQGRRLAPTAFTRSLAEPLGQALRSLGAVLATAGRFDPRATPAVFTVAMRDPMEMVVVPAVARQLATGAPQVEVRFVLARRRTVEAALAEGTLDAAFDVALPLSDRVKRLRITADELVLVARKGHPRLRRGLAFRTYLDLQHVMVTSRRRGPAPEDLALGQRGAHRRVRLRCRSYAAAFRVIERTDFVLTMPRRYAALLARSTGTRLYKLPFVVPTLDGYLYWHEAMDADPANVWLRKALLEALSDRRHTTEGRSAHTA
jgi:DNA-binding transcriptional LysR family regulator